MPTPPFLGRSKEIARLHDGIDAARTGGRVLVVQGEAGIGKTRLIAEATAASGDVTVLRAECEELEQRRAFAPLSRAIGDESLTGAETFDGVEMVLSTFERLTVERPVVLVVEDVHWADADTLRSLRALVRRLAQFRLALVLSMRPAPRNADLDALLDRLPPERTDVVQVGALPRSVVFDIARAFTGAPAGPDLAAALDGAAGIALYVVELLEALRAEGTIEVTGGVARLRKGGIPRSLARTIMRRLHPMGDDTLELLRIASVLGTSFAAAHLATVTGRRLLDLLRPLQDAFSAGVLAQRDDRIVFAHDLIRRAIYETVPEPLRVALHGEVADALQRVHAPLEIVAEHVALSSEPRDALVETLLAAGAEAVFSAPARAVRLLEAALELVGAGETRHDEIEARLLIPLEFVGRRPEVFARGQAILARQPPPPIERLVRRSLGYSHMVDGRASEAVEQYRVGASPAGEANFAGALFLHGDLEAAEHEAARAMAAAAGPMEVIISRIPLTWLALSKGRIAEAVALASLSVREAEGDPSARFGNVWAHLFLAQALMFADDLHGARTAAAEGARVSAEQQRGAQLPAYLMILASIDLAAGSWDEAVANADAALAANEELGLGISIAAGARAVLGRVALYRGDLALAAELLAVPVSDFPFGMDAVLSGRALLAEARRDVPGALATWVDAWDRIRRWGLFLDTLSVGVGLVRCAVACGEDGLASRVTAACQDLARALGEIATAGAHALACRGLRDGDADVLLEAVAVYRRGPQPLPLVLALEDAGRALAAAGRVVEARSAFEEALAMCDSLGATGAVGRVASSMRAAGIGRGTRGPRARPKTGWDSLTPAEVDVVRLVAEGLTNRQVAERLYVSRYTVESHLKHVFGKLGLSSRVELAAAAARREP